MILYEISSRQVNEQAEDDKNRECGDQAVKERLAQERIAIIDEAGDMERQEHADSKVAYGVAEKNEEDQEKKSCPKKRGFSQDSG